MKAIEGALSLKVDWRLVLRERLQLSVVNGLWRQIQISVFLLSEKYVIHDNKRFNKHTHKKDSVAEPHHSYAAQA
jgi:hypothetical protein